MPHRGAGSYESLMPHPNPNPNSCLTAEPCRMSSAGEAAEGDGSGSSVAGVAVWAGNEIDGAVSAGNGDGAVWAGKGSDGAVWAGNGDGARVATEVGLSQEGLERTVNFRIGG